MTVRDELQRAVWALVTLNRHLDAARKIMDEGNQRRAYERMLWETRQAASALDSKLTEITSYLFPLGDEVR